MSELRIALVAEGPTDAVVIEAALTALLSLRLFSLTTLQPEPTRPKMGTGWGGVLRWCHGFPTRGPASLEDGPTLTGFDLFILHIDAHVSGASYADEGKEIETLAEKQSWPLLPDLRACPPPEGCANVMRCCRLAWTGLKAPGPKTVLCVPSTASEAWLTAAVFRTGHKLLTNLECRKDLETQLKVLPKAEKIRKTVPQYREHKGTVTDNWDRVRKQCTQAERFSQDVITACP